MSPEQIAFQLLLATEYVHQLEEEIRNPKFEPVTEHKGDSLCNKKRYS